MTHLKPQWQKDREQCSSWECCGEAEWEARSRGGVGTTAKAAMLRSALPAFNPAPVKE